MMESRMTARGGGCGVEGLSKKGKRTHGHGQQCGDCSGEGGGFSWGGVEG